MLGLLIGPIVGFVLGVLNKNISRLFAEKKLPTMQDIIVGWRRW